MFEFTPRVLGAITIVAAVCVLIPTIALIVVIKQMFDEKKKAKKSRIRVGDHVMVRPELVIPFSGRCGKVVDIEGHDEYVVELCSPIYNGKLIYPEHALLGILQM